MKIIETILFALTIGLFIIGLHQTWVHGILASYFIFTFSVFTLLGFGYVKRTREEKERKQQKTPHSKR